MNTPHAAHQSPSDDDPIEARSHRARLIRSIAKDVRDACVLDAIHRVPRHLFVPGATLEEAYADVPLTIGHGQTISQPTIVGMMTQALELTGSERVLEIGTGSGYQAAVLSLLCREVESIELVTALAAQATNRLATLGYTNVHVHVGDGYQGWPSKAPFDRIILTAAPSELPRNLVKQLADGGLLVAPVGLEGHQHLFRYRKLGEDLVQTDLGGVRFVPMVHLPSA